MPTRRANGRFARTRRGLSSVARSVVARGTQRNFDKRSAQDIAARSARANETLSVTQNRRYVRYQNGPRQTTGRSKLQVYQRDNQNMAVGRWVGMAH